MKRMLSLLLAVLLLVPVFAFASGVEGKLKDRMSTRSGPGTKYNGTYAYFEKGHRITVLSKAYDSKGRTWVQVEFEYQNKLRRAYTGLKRVKVDIDAVPEESPLGSGTLVRDATAWYGPGSRYAQYDDGAPRGADITVYAREKGYCQIEYKAKEYKKKQDEYRRCWVDEDAVSLDGSERPPKDRTAQPPRSSTPPPKKSRSSSKKSDTPSKRNRESGTFGVWLYRSRIARASGGWNADLDILTVKETSFSAREIRNLREGSWLGDIYISSIRGSADQEFYSLNGGGIILETFDNGDSWTITYSEDESLLYDIRRATFTIASNAEIYWEYMDDEAEYHADYCSSPLDIFRSNEDRVSSMIEVEDGVIVRIERDLYSSNHD